MRLTNLPEALPVENLTPEVPVAGKELKGGYVSDLLSDVLANAPPDGVLITVQVHLNVIAVAVHAGLAAIVFAGDRRPEEDVRAKAVEEGIALFVSPSSAFDIVGRLYELGLRGPQA